MGLLHYLQVEQHYLQVAEPKSTRDSDFCASGQQILFDHSILLIIPLLAAREVMIDQLVLGAKDVSPHGLQLCHVGLDGAGEGRLRDRLLHHLRQPDEAPAGHRTRALTQSGACRRCRASPTT